MRPSCPYCTNGKLPSSQHLKIHNKTYADLEIEYPNILCDFRTYTSNRSKNAQANSTADKSEKRRITIEHKRNIAKQQNQKTCPECSLVFVSKNKFCSKTCSAIHTNTHRVISNRKPLSQQALENIRKANDIKIYKAREKIIKNPKITTCVVCNSNMYNSTRKTCSDTCLHKRMQQSGRASAAIRNIRSKDEIQLFELCSQSYPNVFPNLVIHDGWDADIVFSELKIAVLWDGPWHYKQLNIKNFSLKQVQNRDKIKEKVLTKAGYTTLRFRDDQFTPITAFNYIQNYIDQL